ncbi:hypothetical protein [Nocardioides sp. R-C-SC26]|uniref:hypothetical protein n=1 Tax=Nocardioides sp. R-C-SC26 TaxID=2870414 RepID=UPI001E449424|nr:hypothetical protein [Nocardioides sp. R-C-SC26]
MDEPWAQPAVDEGEDLQGHVEDGRPAAPRPDRTGIDRVDAVIDAVADLDGLAPAEQVAVFETAHTELRRALDERPAEHA